jgi:hypothetical protein
VAAAETANFVAEDLVAVRVALLVFPAVSAAVAVYVMVPLVKPLTLMPDALHAPADTGALIAAVWAIPSLATTETVVVSTSGAVPEAVVADWLLLLIGFVTDVTATVGATVSLVLDVVPGLPEFPAESVATAL